MSTPVHISPIEGYRLWARDWDSHASAIVALESRWLLPWLAGLKSKTVLDVSCGTGRWLAHAARQGAVVAGLDLCREMLIEASRKPDVHGALAVADSRRLPVADGCADVVLCTLSLGHIVPVEAVMAEMARAARPGGAVIVSDFHPEAFRQGWKRTFRSGSQVYEIENHYYPKRDLIDCARRGGLHLEQLAEPCFDEPERPIFRSAGKEELFEQVRRTPAVLLARWRKSA